MLTNSSVESSPNPQSSATLLLNPHQNHNLPLSLCTSSAYTPQIRERDFSDSLLLIATTSVMLLISLLVFLWKEFSDRTKELKPVIVPKGLPKDDDHEVDVVDGNHISFSLCTSLVAIKKAIFFHKRGHQAYCKFSNNPFMLGFGMLQILLSQILNFHKLTCLSTVPAITSFCYALIGSGLSLAVVVSGKGETK